MATMPRSEMRRVALGFVNKRNLRIGKNTYAGKAPFKLFRCVLQENVGGLFADDCHEQDDDHQVHVRVMPDELR